MKVCVIPTFCLLLFMIGSCSPKSYSNREYMRCQEVMPDNDDTSKIIYELLVRTIPEQLVNDFDRTKDKQNVFVLDTYFLPRCSNQDTSGFSLNQKVHSIPYRIGSTRFCLKTEDELKQIAARQETVLYPLQIGFITIKDDSAITGMQTYAVKGANVKGVLLGGGGTHFLFKKVDGHWFYNGTGFCDWISKKKNICCDHTGI